MNQNRQGKHGHGDEEYSPRPHDHIVEPVFGGLGVEPNGDAGGDSAGRDKGDVEAKRSSGGGCTTLILAIGALAWLSS